MFIKLKNLKVYYKVAGSGAPIVLLHGWGGSSAYFSKLGEYLSQKFMVYVLDLPGFGLSTAPEEVWGSKEYGYLVRDFIEELQISNPILLGHSFGGKIVINLVAHNLINVERMILIGSAGVRLPKPLKIKWRIYFFKLLKFLTELSIIKLIFASKMELYKYRFGSKDYQNAKGIMRAILVKTVNEDIVELLSSVKIPTLLLWGEQDYETPLEAGRILQRAILKSQLKIIPGSGHFPFLDNLDLVTTELDSFLR